jgi:hypothetical protein
VPRWQIIGRAELSAIYHAVDEAGAAARPRTSLSHAEHSSSAAGAGASAASALLSRVQNQVALAMRLTQLVKLCGYGSRPRCQHLAQFGVHEAAVPHFAQQVAVKALCTATTVVSTHSERPESASPGRQAS